MREDAGLLDYPHEAGNDGVEGFGFQFGFSARCNQSRPKQTLPVIGVGKKAGPRRKAGEDVLLV